jgi:predicted metal-dependent phosphoesterase TrpH
MPDVTPATIATATIATATIDVELHSHTHFSRDSLNRIDDMVRTCREVGIDRIAITDHNRIEGALRAKAIAPELVIVSEEVKTTQGELLCLFIHEFIPRGLRPEEAIDRIHAQGGIVGAPHPLDPLRAGLGREAVVRLRDKLEFIEAFNARTHDSEKNAAANALALELGLPRSAGSDAHTLGEIGNSRVRMRPFDADSPQDFLAALRDATLITRTASPLVHLESRWAVAVHRLGLDRSEPN